MRDPRGACAGAARTHLRSVSRDRNSPDNPRGGALKAEQMIKQDLPVPLFYTIRRHCRKLSCVLYRSDTACARQLASGTAGTHPLSALRQHLARSRSFSLSTGLRPAPAPPAAPSRRHCRSAAPALCVSEDNIDCQPACGTLPVLGQGPHELTRGGPGGGGGGGG